MPPTLRTFCWIALASVLATAGCDRTVPPATDVREPDASEPDASETAPDVTVPSLGFTDERAASGIRFERGPWPLHTGPMNAAAIADCDRDGLPDAFVVNWAGAGTLWRNLGGFRFEAMAPPPGLAGNTPSAAAFGDLDNDGLPDLIVALGIEELLREGGGGMGPLLQELRVYRNHGGCQFEDVSTAWGFGAWPSNASSLIAGIDLADVNLDGRLDLVGRRILDRDAPMRLYLSRPDGTWTESMADVIGPIPGSNWTNFFTDIDDDGLADLFLVFDQRLGGSARFLHRIAAAARRPFVEEVFDPRLFGPDAPAASLMGAASGDVDGDGFLDLYLLDIGAQHLFTHRSGRHDVAAQAGVDLPELYPGTGIDTVGFSASLADYDNDTWPDLAVVCGTVEGWETPPQAFLRHNRGDGTFEDASELLHQQGPFAGQWMSASDLDRDGRVDYWMGGSAALPRILRNQVAAGRSLAVRLHGRTSNAEGVGAKVTARIGPRSLVQEMQSGGAAWGYGEHRLVFGIGRADAVDSLEVRWPDGYVQRTGRVAAGTETVVEEPDLVRVEPRVASIGANVIVTVRPARVTGEPLGTGHRVTVVMDPGDVTLAVADDGSGGYTATTRGITAGVYGFTVSIDGAALFAHPQFLAR